MSNKRLEPKARKRQILAAALITVGAPGGWSNLTRERVGRQAGCADSLISSYFGTMSTFRRTIMRAAIVDENLSVIAQGLAAGDKYARKAPDDLKQQALASLR